LANNCCPATTQSGHAVFHSDPDIPEDPFQQKRSNAALIFGSDVCPDQLTGGFTLPVNMLRTVE
jgi:hypothetical protein